MTDKFNAEDDAPDARLPSELTTEMTRLFNAGFSLIPLGGTKGKRANVTYRNSRRLPLRVVADRMSAARSFAFGIRTSGLLVVDVDTDTPEARSYVERRFGPSPGRTRTGRGYHLYFRHVGAKPRDVELPNISIEFKTGDNMYVVGPGSTRPDGVVYVAEGQLVAPSFLPWFVDYEEFTGLEAGNGSNPSELRSSNRVQPGFRYTALKKRAYQLAIVADQFVELVADLVAFRDWEIEGPEEFSDASLQELAQWFWDKRESGQLWGGKNSGVFLHRHAISELAKRGEGLALLVYSVAMAAHGHARDKEFALSPDGLRASGRICAGRAQIYDAIHLLVELSLLDRRKFHQGKRVFYRYRFGKPWQAESGRGRSALTLVPETGTSLRAARGEGQVA